MSKDSFIALYYVLVMDRHKQVFVAITYTGKSFLEVLILASTNPQYDKRFSGELPVQYMKIPSSEHGENMLF